MKVINVVGAVIVNDNKEILCAKRSQQISLPGLWEFPGGKIEQGEDTRFALVREIREELLCDIEVGDLIADIVHDYPNFKVRFLTYYARVTKGVPTVISSSSVTSF